jgi:hypothetical protein
MTRAEAILQALFAALTVPPMVSAPAAQCFRDEEQATEQALLPAVIITEGDEPAAEQINYQESERFLEFSLTVRAKGASTFAAADAALLEAHNRVMADERLGGLAEEITEGPTRRERADLNTKLCRVEKGYRVRYRTGEKELT